MATFKNRFFNNLFLTLILPLFFLINCSPSFWDDFEKIIPNAALEVRYGFVNAKGEWVIDPIYQSARDFSNGLALVSNRGKSFYIYKSNEVLGKVSFDEAGDFGLDGAIVKEAGYYGYIADNGSYIIKPKYVQAYPIHNGFALVNELGGSDFSYINLNSLNPILNFSHSEDFEYSILKLGNSLFPYFCQEGKWSFANDLGEQIFPCQFDSVRSFSEGKAGVAKIQDSGEILWGYINESGEPIVPYEYSEVSDYKNGLAFVSKLKEGKETYYLLDVNGKKYVKQGFVTKPEIGSEYTFVMENWEEGYYLGPEKQKLKARGSKITEGCPFQNGRFLVHTDQSKFSEGQVWLDESGQTSPFSIDKSRIPEGGTLFTVGCPSENGLVLVGISFYPKIFDRNTFPLPRFSFLN